ncbi:toxic anion resistance protein [Psychrobacter sp. TAE2020]|uniref:toxic anion resistance protein n=1 Tax=Psychrobacter sp. TAE2020 TaxID=2846762 RepID=UPI001C10E2E0|nr:toxic anion resistance protein [Psychrobacter sp. TAE2020]MBU5617190.1 toxic anion resistance protein [Psychrobacter sp. TAE2020]
MQELTPPENTPTPIISLTPPAAVKEVQKSEADQMVTLDASQLPELDAKVDAFVNHVLTNSVHSDEFKQNVQSIHNLGSKEIRESSQISNRMLELPAKSLNDSLFDNSPIAKSLTELRGIVEDLDPSKKQLTSSRKLFGLIPFGNKVQDYFRQYESAQSHINAVVTSLYNGKDELLKDNAMIEQEKVNMWELMQSIRQYVYVGKKIDEQLEQKVYTIEATDPEKARIIKEEMLFYVRQKNTDFLTQLAVNIQGYLALDTIRRNNLELIKGVDRATTTTVSALRTAVIVAQAMTNQKLVLDQITALNKTTSSLIESTSEMLKRQSGEIHEQATSSTIELDKLQNAFNNVYETMDMISTYKLEALENMKQTVNTLTSEVDKAQKYLDKSNETTVLEVSREIDTKKIVDNSGANSIDI